jgi:hypothetical protein
VSAASLGEAATGRGWWPANISRTRALPADETVTGALEQLGSISSLLHLLARSAFLRAAASVLSGRDDGPCPRTSRLTRAIHATAWTRSHWTYSGSRTARIQRLTVDSGRFGNGAMRGIPSRGRWPAARSRSPRWCRPAVAPRRRTAERGWQGRCGSGLAAVAGARVVVPWSRPLRPERAPTPAVVRRLTGKAASRPRGRSRPVRDRRCRSSGRGGGTTHERGRPGPRPAGSTGLGRSPRRRRGPTAQVDRSRLGTMTIPATMRRARRWARHVDRHAGGADEHHGHEPYVVTVDGGNRPPTRHPRWRSTVSRRLQ